EASRIVDIRITTCRPAVARATLLDTGRADRVSHGTPDAIVAIGVIPVHVQQTGLAETTVLRELPRVRQHVPLAPTVSVRIRAFLVVREDLSGFGQHVDGVVIQIRTTEEVLDVSSRSEDAVREDLRV